MIFESGFDFQQDGTSFKDIFHTSLPPSNLKISEWADNYRALSPESSPEPGRWYTERTEYLREIMDCILDPMIEDVDVMCSAQVGKTETLNNIIAYFIDQDPSPIMVVQPTLEMAESWSRDRLSPMIRDTKKIFDKINSKKSRSSENTIYHKNFSGGNLTICGANSPSSLAGRPKRIVIGDDVDRFPLSAGSEGDPVNLMFKRTTAFWNRKRILFSTPTNQESRIYKEFLLSDQRYYFVPCINCGEYQKLLWKDRDENKYYVRWELDSRDKYIKGSAYYECKYCERHLTDSDILWMVKKGVWRPSKKFQGRAGFNLNELYSPFVTLDETVRTFFDVKNDVERLKTWVNTALNEIFIERGDAPPWEQIYIRREKYEKGIIPEGGLLLVAGCDVQKDRIEVEIIAYGRGKESWSVDYRIISGEVAAGKPFEKLDELLEENFSHINGSHLSIRMLAIDSGYETQAVYNWARKYPYDRVMAVKGTDLLSTVLGGPRNTDIFINGKKFKKGMKYWPIGVSILKSELYGLLRLEKKKDGSFPLGYCHFPEYDEEYFKQLTAESLKIVKTRTNKKIFRWEVDYTRNEALDVRNYGRAAAAALGLDRFTERTWKLLEEEMKIKIDQSASLVPARKKKKVISRGIDI